MAAPSRSLDVLRTISDWIGSTIEASPGRRSASLGLKSTLNEEQEPLVEFGSSTGAKENIEIATINLTGLSDVPTEQDGIGFHPYTRAIAWFLLNEKTKPPLTLSIEGPWGSGKSSFMLQLQKQLEEQNIGEHEKYFIKFNAWRSDKDEALWAAFALTFIKQLEPEIRARKRILANVTLLWKRLDWKRGWLQLAQIAIFTTAFLSLTIYALIHPEVVAHPNINTIVFGIPWLAAGYFGFDKSKKIFGNPLSRDLSKFVRNLKYEEKVAFIDRFQDDFADIVKSYVGEKGRVFIFIDDLDRCEIPRSAELLQAINLLLSADQGNLFFILGLDREMVAAGIAAKNERILPYLAAGRYAAGSDKSDFYRIGIDYGYSFMEKFIQVPFRVPRPDDREIKNWVLELTNQSSVHDISQSQSPHRSDPIEIHSGADPLQFEEVVQTLAQVFGFNPRRLKQFVNVFRLRVTISLSTGVLIPEQQNSSGPSIGGGITIRQIGLFTAILMRWSRLTGDLVEEPTLFDQLSSTPNQSTSGIAAKWATDNELRKVISFDPAYSLINVNLKPLLMIMPDAYFGMLRDGGSRQRTRLVAGGEAQASDGVPPDANFSTTPNAPPNVRSASGATGPTGPSGSVPSA